MIDQRFFRRAGPFPLARIAALVEGTLSHTDMSETLAHDIATPEDAGETDISFFSDRNFRECCRRSRAVVLVTSSRLAGQMNDRPLLLVNDARLAYARIGGLFYPDAAGEPHIAPGAHVDPTASVGKGCRIEAGAYVGAGATLGARCRIGQNATIGDCVVLGDDCRIDANCAITHAILGARVHLKAGATVGGEGFGFVSSPDGLMRMPQLGCVVIEDDVEIGNNCTIDRGGLSNTVIGRGTKIDNLVHIAHNVRIGKFCIITAQVGIAGSSTVGDQTMIGGQTAIADHVNIGARVKIVAKSGLIRDIADGETVAGIPAIPIRDWHRQTVAIAKLTGHKPGGTK